MIESFKAGTVITVAVLLLMAAVAWSLGKALESITRLTQAIDRLRVAIRRPNDDGLAARWDKS